jgi:hypothetical protein
MDESSHRIPPVRELVDTDLAAAELERLERVDALLRATRPRLRLVATPDEQTQRLSLSYRELSLIYRSLQAAKTLRALPAEGELLDDTLQVVDQALREAI